MHVVKIFSNSGVLAADEQGAQVVLLGRGLGFQAATATGLPVQIARAGQAPVDARSILLVMSMGVGHGEDVVLTVEGAGADQALDALVELLFRDLDAE